MKNPLSKTELTGLILLALLIVGITGCALLVKSCGSVPLHDEVRAPVEIVDSALNETGAATRKYQDKRKGRGKREASKKSKKKKNLPILRKDPFSDTVPMSE